MSKKLIIPEAYTPKLNNYDMQLAISTIKTVFLEQMCIALNLKRVSAPLFVKTGIGLNDNLSGVERPVTFDIPDIGIHAEIVHSLAKWKRVALKQYGFHVHNGLLTDMNAIRRDEELDNLHSVYVDQWDWEKVITADDRNEDYLKETVTRIVTAICNTNDRLKWQFPQLSCDIDRHISFVSSEELEELYPELTPVEREHAYVKTHRTTFITHIGDKLKNGIPHGNRAPDYDDWSLNGDLLVWNEILGVPMELSSMGIRVDPPTLASQLEKAGCPERSREMYHAMLLRGELPLTVGGGIGQSRLCMQMLQCAHIGEVQAAIWDAETVEACSKSNIKLL